jgi:hypothetical protein
MISCACLVFHHIPPKLILILTKRRIKPQNIKKSPLHYFESGKNQTKKYRENLRHMEETTFTDNDSLQSQPQPSYSSKNVPEIANEWNTTASSSEG